MSEWVQGWFNSPLYTQVYKHRSDDEAAQVIALITGTLSLPAGGSALDLGCGSGRHSHALARAGFHPTGIDMSDYLLNLARESSLKQGLSATWIKGDISTIRLSQKYNLVINLFTSFGYSDEDAQNFLLFDTAKCHLADGGFFVFDYLNPENLAASLVPHSREKTAAGYIEQVRKIENGVCLKDIIVQQANEILYRCERVKLYSPARVKSELFSRGFAIRHCFGDYQGGKFSHSHSPRMLLICAHE